MDIMEIYKVIQKAAVRREICVVAIDGRCAAGKTTLAASLAELTGAAVIHMDDFFLPMELRTAQRMDSPGGNVHYERFQEEVLPCLGKRGAFSYAVFDCSVMQLGGQREVPTAPLQIVEGAYSCHPAFGNYMDLRIFADVKEQAQLEHIRMRNGEAALENFRKLWIPMEEKYIQSYQIREQADVIYSFDQVI